MSLSTAEVIRLVSSLTSRDRNLVAGVWGGTAVHDPASMERALFDAAAALLQAGIPYALIGGMAVAVHTRLPRATLDVDLALPSTVDRERAIDVLAAAGFALRGRFEHSVNLLHPTGCPVQLAFDPPFDAAIAAAEKHPVGGQLVAIVRRDDLIALKERAAADPRRRRSKALRDQLDIEMLRGDVPDPDEGW
jgi:hypothetical protein